MSQKGIGKPKNGFRLSLWLPFKATKGAPSKSQKGRTEIRALWAGGAVLRCQGVQVAPAKFEVPQQMWRLPGVPNRFPSLLLFFRRFCLVFPPPPPFFRGGGGNHDENKSGGSEEVPRPKETHVCSILGSICLNPFGVTQTTRAALCSHYIEVCPPNGRGGFSKLTWILVRC